MEVLLKEFDLGKDKCNICFKEIDNGIIKEMENGIINVKHIICNKCIEKIGNLSLNDVEYICYKNNIKTWLANKYKL